MSVTNELLGRKEALALHALDTPCRAFRVQFRHTESATLAKALVVDLERDARDFVQPRRNCATMKKSAAESFGIGLGDEAAGRGAGRQNTGHLQFLQLFGGTTRTINLQFVAYLVYLGKTKISQHTIKNLRQAQSFFPADNKAGDALALQGCFRALAARPVRCCQDGQLLNG